MIAAHFFLNKAGQRSHSRRFYVFVGPTRFREKWAQPEGRGDFCPQQRWPCRHIEPSAMHQHGRPRQGVASFAESKNRSRHLYRLFIEGGITDLDVTCSDPLGRMSVQIRMGRDHDVPCLAIPSFAMRLQNESSHWIRNRVSEA